MKVTIEIKINGALEQDRLSIRTRKKVDLTNKIKTSFKSRKE